MGSGAGLSIAAVGARERRGRARGWTASAATAMLAPTPCLVHCARPLDPALVLLSLSLSLFSYYRPHHPRLRLAVCLLGRLHHTLELLLFLAFTGGRAQVVGLVDVLLGGACRERERTANDRTAAALRPGMRAVSLVPWLHLRPAVVRPSLRDPSPDKAGLESFSSSPDSSPLSSAPVSWPRKKRRAASITLELLWKHAASEQGMRRVSHGSIGRMN